MFKPSYRSSPLTLLAAAALLTFSSNAQMQTGSPERPTGLLHAPDHITLSIPDSVPSDRLELLVSIASGPPMRIAIWPHSQRAENFEVLDSTGIRVPESQLPQVSTFAGSVVGRPGSVVAASLHEHGWRIIVDDGVGVFTYVQPWEELYPNDANVRGKHAVFTADELSVLEGRCGGSPGLPAANVPHGGFASRASCIMTAEIAFDADHELYLANGSSLSATVTDVESVINAVDLIYARDVGIDHSVTSITVRDNVNDPYSMTEAGAILGEFATYWQNNHGSVPRDVAHLMTGREVDGNIIGVAYLSAICGYGYGYSQTRFTNNMAFRTGLTAHELGHNWGAGHCDGDSDCFIMCSGIGGCSGNVTKFGNRSMRDIPAFRDSISCLTPSGPFPTALAPVARADTAPTATNTPVLIDVLLNDVDGNCDNITITGFTSVTANATISRSVGTGPGGRDQLRYAPRAGFSGTETFTYIVSDTTGRQTSSTVTVNVLALRAGVQPSFSRAGLAATYFELSPQYVPDFSRHPVIATNTLTQLNFPASSNVVAGSGLTSHVGARFTGTLTIPTSGTYTFFTESDDGSVLYINDQLIVANDGVQGSTERSGTIPLLAGTANFRIEYFQGEGQWSLIARIQGPSLTKQVIPASLFGVNGLAATYYGFAGIPADMPNLNNITPVLHNVTFDINQASANPWLLTSARAYSIAGRFDGYVTVPTSGVYTFYTRSDDGSTLNIGTDLARIVTNGGPHGMVERSGYVGLQAGTHPIRIEHWQGGGGAGIEVSIQGPGVAKQVIPAAMFSHTPAGAVDCNDNALLDLDETVVKLDAGDMLVGGNGSVNSSRNSLGVDPLTGRLAQVGVFSGSRTSGVASFAALDGASGRLLAPFIDGVFVPNGVTRISRTGTTFRFSPSIGGYWNAMRNSLGDTAPIITADYPGVTRRGIGMHANSGITFDIAAMRAANGGRPIYSFDGVAGLSIDGCEGSDIHIEFHVLVDGVSAYRRLISPRGNMAEPFSIALPDNANKVTVASLDADGGSCDHFVLSDAVFVAAASNDVTLDRIPDSCQCPADFNTDGGVDGADVEAFFTAWTGAESTADVNFDGGIDGLDVEFFFVAWAAGGC